MCCNLLLYTHKTNAARTTLSSSNGKSKPQFRTLFFMESKTVQDVLWYKYNTSSIAIKPKFTTTKTQHLSYPTMQAKFFTHRKQTNRKNNNDCNKVSQMYHNHINPISTQQTIKPKLKERKTEKSKKKKKKNNETLYMIYIN